MERETIEAVKGATDLVALISRDVKLERAGRIQRGLCPFHQEKTPSFVVFPDTGTWHCFGCHAGGDAVAYVMRRQRLNFTEAVQELAARAGITVESTRPEGAPRRDYEQFYALNEAAASFYAGILREHPKAAPIRAYLAGRGIGPEACARFGLGYAPDTWGVLHKHLTSQGFTDSQMIELGLVKLPQSLGQSLGQNLGQSPGQAPAQPYDFFRNRIIFPIRDRQGRVSGFAGRAFTGRVTPGESEPSQAGQAGQAGQESQVRVAKYINTPDTPVFKKRAMLYGMHNALKGLEAASSGAVAVIVEGYTDVIAAHMAGYDNVLGCMGTALTAEQVRWLRRYTAQVIVALDADAAGEQGALRAINQARQGAGQGGELTISVAVLPPGKDPDEVLLANPAAWPRLLAQAQPMADFVIDRTLASQDLSQAAGKMAAMRTLTPLLAELTSIERDHYMQMVADRLGVQQPTVARLVREHLNALPPKGYGASPQESSQESSQAPGQNPEQEGDEEYLAAALLAMPGLLPWLREALKVFGLPGLDERDFRRAENAAIVARLAAAADAGEDLEALDVAEFTAAFDPALADYAAARLAGWEQGTPDLVALRRSVLTACLRLRLNYATDEAAQLMDAGAEAGMGDRLEAAARRVLLLKGALAVWLKTGKTGKSNRG